MPVSARCKAFNWPATPCVLTCPEKDVKKLGTATAKKQLALSGKRGDSEEAIMDEEESGGGGSGETQNPLGEGETKEEAEEKAEYLGEQAQANSEPKGFSPQLKVDAKFKGQRSASGATAIMFNKQDGEIAPYEIGFIVTGENRQRK